MIENLLVLLLPRKSHRAIKTLVRVLVDNDKRYNGMWKEAYIDIPARARIQMRRMGVVGIEFRRYIDQVDIKLLGLGCHCGNGQKNRTLYCAPRDTPQWLTVFRIERAIIRALLEPGIHDMLDNLIRLLLVIIIILGGALLWA